MRPFLRLAPAALGLAGLVAGCGSSSSSSGAPADADTDADTNVATDDASPSGAHVLWGTSFPGAGEATAVGVAEDGAGATLVVGSFAESIDLGQGAVASKGGQDLFVAKLDPSGKPAWGHAYGDPGQQSAAAVATDPSGNVVVLGNFDGTIDLGTGPLTGHGPEGDVLLAKLDGAGHALWAHGYGDPKTQQASDLAIDRDGNLVHVGTTAGKADLGGGVVSAVGDLDAYVAKVDASGKTAWARGFGGSGGSSGASAVAIDGKGNVYVAGGFTGAIDLGAGAVKSVDGQDAFLVALDPTGNVLWSKVFGGPGDQAVSAMAVDASGAIVLGGQLSGPTDFGGGATPAAAGMYLAKLDGAGAGVWTRAFVTHQASVRGLALDAAGAPIFVGAFKDDLDLGGGALSNPGVAPYTFDLFVGALGPDGAHRWSRQGHSAGYGAARVALDASGNVALVGSAASRIDLGTVVGAVTDKPRPFVLKLGR